MEFEDNSYPIPIKEEDNPVKRIEALKVHIQNLKSWFRYRPPALILLNHIEEWISEKEGSKSSRELKRDFDEALIDLCYRNLKEGAE